jgi:YesN/AraC family two-component response regulator
LTFRPIPALFILFTGYSETVSPETAREAGISEFVMKPIAKREVAETIRRVLDKRERSKAM